MEISRVISRIDSELTLKPRVLSATASKSCVSQITTQCKRRDGKGTNKPVCWNRTQKWEKKEENDRSAPLGPQEPDPPQGNTLGGGYVSMTSVANRSLIFCAFPQLRPFLERF